MNSSDKYNTKLLSHPFAFIQAVLVIAVFSFSDSPISNNVTSPSLKESEDEEFLLPQVEIVSGEDYITIPFKYAGRLVMVEAVIDGQSGNLIFDTGASGIVMNRTYFRKYIPMNSQKSNGITGGVDKVSTIAIDKLRIADLEMKKFRASVADLGHIENQKGVKVLGLFGFEAIKNFEIVIDFNRQIMQLHKIDKNGNRLSATSSTPDYIQKFETSKNIIFLKGIIAGKELKFCLDTGAESNVISSHANKSVLKTIAVTQKSDLHGVGASRSQVLSGTMTDFRYGDNDMPAMSCVVTNLDALCEAYETSIDGMLGYDFLKKGIFCINFAKRQIGITYFKKQ